MFRLNLKIALRNLWSNRSTSIVNIGGLAIALAAAILVAMYVTYEAGFDRSNPNYDRIYVLGRSAGGKNTNNTSPALARAVRQNFPEVERIGMTTQDISWELPVRNGDKVIYAKNILVADYEALQILNLKPGGGLRRPPGNERLFYLSTAYMRTLFPGKTDSEPALVGFGASTTGITGVIQDSIPADLHSSLVFDGLSVANELGQGGNYDQNEYITYLMVRPGTNAADLEAKINRLYRAELAASAAAGKNTAVSELRIFLDPLANQHLHPKAGSDGPYTVLVVLSALSVLILGIACINFTNLTIAQAARRAKEVGVKKVIGAYRIQLAMQFLTELFLQCLAATILALLLAELVLPDFNGLLGVRLSIPDIKNGLIWQLPVILCVITALAGIYPAAVLSGFKPAFVLKGNFSAGAKRSGLRNLLLAVQFGIAVIFMTCLFVIHSQLRYIRGEDLGFNASQVVYIRNLTLFNDPAVFKPVREKISKIPGLQSVSVTSGIPDGSANNKIIFIANGIQSRIDLVNVDFGYFETLEVRLKEGRFFSQEFNTDTASSAIINESAVAKFGLTKAVGQTIRNKETNYKIVGVVKDFKAQGFENAVQPTIYTIKNAGPGDKLHILLKFDPNRMTEALAALKAEWKDVNLKDGEDFRYEFLDERYARLFHKQEQLQTVFGAAAVTTILVAVLGLFALSKYMTNSRTKEIAVRKILGAGDLQILRLINHSFLTIVIVANILSWPVAYILTKLWLETFAYRIDMPAWPFITSMIATASLTLLTVSLQAGKVLTANPAKALKRE